MKLKISRKAINYAYYLIIILFTSCEKDYNVEKEVALDISEAKIENGYLNFQNQESLNVHILNLSKQLKNIKGSKSSVNVNTPKGFVSLASQINLINLKSKNEFKNNGELESELFLNELNKALIPEEILHYVLDTARRIKVAGEIYQITEAGTFIYTDKDTIEFENLYDGFLENYLNHTGKVGDCTYLYGNIKFIDSYNFIENRNLSIENIVAMVNGDESPCEEKTKSSSNRIVKEYTSAYNLTNYRVGGSTWAGQELARIGLNNWRSKYFDSGHRVRSNLYELDYGFYKCAGFKCKFQYKKRVTVKVGWGRWKKTITLFSYWTGKTAPEMAIGIDYFKGYTEMEDFGLEPESYNQASKKHSKEWANLLTKIVFQGFLSEPEALLEDWVSNLHVFSGSVEVLGNTYTDSDAFAALYDLGYNWLTDEFTNKTSGFVYEMSNRNSKAPAMMLSPGIGEHRNREYLMLNGVTNYKNKSYKKVRLGQPSGGVKLSFNNSSWDPRVGCYTPNAFKIQEAYIFGAVKYNGVWKGVRMYIN